MSERIFIHLAHLLDIRAYETEFIQLTHFLSILTKFFYCYYTITIWHMFVAFRNYYVTFEKSNPSYVLQSRFKRDLPNVHDDSLALTRCQGGENNTSPAGALEKSKLKTERKKCSTYFHIETHTSEPISRNVRKRLKRGFVSKFSGCSRFGKIPDSACAEIANISYVTYFLNQLSCSQNN